MLFEVFHLLALQKQNRNNRTCMSYKKRVGSSAHIHHRTSLIPTSVDLTCMSAQRLENTHTQTTTLLMHTRYENANKAYPHAA